MNWPSARRAAPLVVAGLIAQRLGEIRLAKANEAWARDQGAVEHGRGHYPAFFVLHPAWMLGMLLESRRSDAPLRPGWLALALLAQPARVATMRALGRQWTTRILIVPGAARVRSGPYRYTQHPAYAVVTAELLVTPLALRAPRTAVLATLANAALLGLLRIPAENRALAAYDRPPAQPASDVPDGASPGGASPGGSAGPAAA